MMVNTIRLIVIDNEQNLRYYEACRLKMDKKIKHLIIMHSDKEEESFYAAFKRTFINAYGFILCIDKCVIDRNKYFIIFQNSDKYQTFIQSANKRKEKFKQYITVAKNDKLFNSSFLKPIAEKCVVDSVLDGQLKPILEKLIQYYPPYQQEIGDSHISPIDYSTTSNNQLCNNVREYVPDIFEAEISTSSVMEDVAMSETENNIESPESSNETEENVLPASVVGFSVFGSVFGSV
uniref:Uncharacterized protein n=1 Tax=Panagrolaimus sp. ES5 TaxID=591445 RepID=A0AC34FHQ6_9BILA